MRLKSNSKGQFFHPFELAFCGYSNSGKTTLISKIIRKLSYQFDIGYLKHDAHRFSMDHEGKDTWVMKSNGAKSTLINDPSHYAFIEDKELEQFDIQMKIQDMDMLLIEGHKFSKLPKLILLSENENYEKMIQHIEQDEISHVLGIVSFQNEDPFKGKYPFFHRDNIDKITTFILDHFHRAIPTKINGLILTGGKSSRMNEDKGSLNYHGNMSQIEYSQSLLEGFCQEIYVSCREDQKNLDFLRGHQLLFDSFPSVGPTTGILSAQFKEQNCAWIVLACDLPYLDKETIFNLVKNRNPFKNATCYLNPKRKWPEPLCTIYEPKSFLKLMQYFSINKPCPRKVLFNSNIEALTLKNEMALDNVNTPQEKENALNTIKSQGEIYAN